MYWYLKILKNYAEFNGRARRKEYWMFALINLIFMLVAMALDAELGSPGIAYFVYVVFTLIPHLAVTIRRLHDVGKSGWFVLLLLIPIIGAIGILAQACKKGEAGPNEYGPDPKEATYNLV